MMTIAEFHNALCALMRFDRDDLRNGGLWIIADDTQWRNFRSNPWDWWVRATYDDKKKLWALIEKRTKP